MPVIASMIGVPIVATAIITIALIYTASELLRIEGYNLPVVSAVTRHAANQSELFGFAAAPLYFAFGIVTTLLLFPTGRRCRHRHISAKATAQPHYFGGI
jgi:hypothetical protein